MNIKKILLGALSLVLVAALAVGGTLAYLTDRDSEVNIFTVGNVSIDLNEAFDQGATLIPGVNIEKKPTVTNTGKNDAWVWLTFSIPSALDNFVQGTEQGSNENVIHWNPKGATTEGYVSESRVNEAIASGFLSDATLTADSINTNKMHWNVFNSLGAGKNVYTENIGGVNYNTYVLLYNKALEPGETTLPNIEKVFLDARVDIDPNGDWYFVENGTATKLAWNTNTDGNPKIYVCAYGIQAEGFETVNAAYAAYQTQWGTNGSAVSVVPVQGADKSALVSAIAEAKDGDIITLTEDTVIAGSAATDKLVIEKAITLDLNGKTITTECGWGGIDLKGGASIINGTINHVGNTAAIKAFQVGTIENVTINVTETAGKIKGGIVVQQGDGCYVGSIKNVTITGATNGIECYRSTAAQAIGSMENVKINATDNGIYINGAGNIGTISNCEISGGNIGINAYLANLWHISLDIRNSTVTGGMQGIDIWDEAAVNTGSTVTFDHADTTFVGGTWDIKVTLGDEIACAINGANQAAPCTIYVQE